MVRFVTYSALVLVILTLGTLLFVCVEGEYTTRNDTRNRLNIILWSDSGLLHFVRNDGRFASLRGGNEEVNAEGREAALGYEANQKELRVCCVE